MLKTSQSSGGFGALGIGPDFIPNTNGKYYAVEGEIKKQQAIRKKEKKNWDVKCVDLMKVIIIVIMGCEILVWDKLKLMKICHFIQKMEFYVITS
jgi:hypothetical protein